jgi:hypothetical protein
LLLSATVKTGQLLSFMLTCLNDCLVLLSGPSTKTINPQTPERDRLCHMKDTMDANTPRKRVGFTHRAGTGAAK